jgi:hypothetical protein
MEFGGDEKAGNEGKEDSLRSEGKDESVVKGCQKEADNLHLN